MMIMQRLRTKKVIPAKMAEDEPLSPVARMFVDNCIITIIGCKIKIDPHIILHSLKHNVSKHPRFSSKISDDGGRWIKTEVNVEDHVFVPEEEIEDGESFVDEYISRLTTIPLERSRPLWDIHILNVKTSDAEAICVVRSHHSLGDGMSIMSLLVACTRKTSDPEAFPTIPAVKRREKVLYGLGERNMGWVFRMVLAFCSMVKLIWNTLVDLLLLLARATFLNDTMTALKGGHDVENNPRRFYRRILSLDDIRLIKNTMNTTVNDVLLGVTQAALSRYLNRRYGETNRMEDQNSFPSKIRLCAAVAINLRSDIGIQPLEDMMAKGSRCRWGNYVGLAFIPFSIGLEMNPLVYILKAKSVMDRKKHSLQAALAYKINGFIIKTLKPKAKKGVATKLLLNTTTFVSNVVGPVEEVSFHGHPIAYIALSISRASHPLVIHFVSYADKMVVTLGVDTTVISDAQKLCDDIEESLKAMKVAVEERRLP